MNRDKGYLICQHPEHSAVAEIFSAAEYRQIKRLHARYVVLTKEPTYDEAVERLRRVVEKLRLNRENMTELKTRLREELR